MKYFITFIGIITFFTPIYAQYTVPAETIINDSENTYKLSLQKDKKTLPYSALWDTMHGVMMNAWKPSSKYSTLVTLMDSAGYYLEIKDSSVDRINLSTYDIIIICSGSAAYTPYTSPEIDSLFNYVTGKNGRVVLTGDADFCGNGSVGIDSVDNRIFISNTLEWLRQTGGLFIMAEYPPWSGNDNIAGITSKFNMNIGLSCVNPVSVHFSTFAQHPLFSGVSVLYNWGIGELSASSPSAAVAWDSGGGKAVIAIYPAGGAVEENAKRGLRIAEFKIIRNKICLEMPNSENVELKLYDLCGRLKETLHSGTLTKGNYMFTPKIKTTGIYFVTLSTDQTKQTKKLILVK